MALRKVGCFVRQILFAFVIFHRSGEVTMKRIVLICYGLFVTMTLMSNALFVSWDKNANLTRDDIFIGFRQIYVPKVFGSVTPAFRNLTSHSLDERCSKGMALSISWSLHEPYSGVLGPKIGKQLGFAARGIFPSEYEPYQTKHSIKFVAFSRRSDGGVQRKVREWGKNKMEERGGKPPSPPLSVFPSTSLCAVPQSKRVEQTI